MENLAAQARPGLSSGAVSGHSRDRMLQITDLTFDAWGRRFFEGASVTVPTGAKVGLVGRNGTGKSTLFKIILGELHTTGGEIVVPKGHRIATVDQEAAASPVSLLEASVVETLLGAVRVAAFVMPAGLGVQEGALILLCGWIGVPPAPAFAMALN